MAPSSTAASGGVSSRSLRGAAGSPPRLPPAAAARLSGYLSRASGASRRQPRSPSSIPPRLPGHAGFMERLLVHGDAEPRAVGHLQQLILCRQLLYITIG